MNRLSKPRPEAVRSQATEATGLAFGDAFPRVVLVAFGLTGMTALAAEVVLSRILSYVFGASHWATATVLAAYMAGLALGTYLLGLRSDRRLRPAATYARLELAVALYYVGAPLAYPPFRALVVDVTRSLGDSAALVPLARFAFSAAFVFLPTILIGGTLPVLAGAFVRGDALGHRLPILYATNTLGAATGALLAAYLAIPLFGIDGTLGICAMVNAMVALTILVLARGSEGLPPEEDRPRLVTSAEAPTASPPSVVQIGSLAFGQGMLAFALEVVWTHMVGTVIGVTVHAFAIMLAAILLGIALGSAVLPALRRRVAIGSAQVFAWAQCGLGVWLLVSLPLWDRFPDVVNACLAVKAHWGFVERESIRLLFALALLLPATVCLGLGLPALTAAAGASRAESSAGLLVGRVFAANTLGAIVGALACGFWLLGRVPSGTILLLCSGSALALGGLATALGGGRADRRLRLGLFGSVAALLAVAFAWPGWHRARLTAGSHYYWQPWPGPSPPPAQVFFAEDPQAGFVTVERSPSGLLSMKTNGKYEGSDGFGEFQDYMALIGVLYAKRLDHAFVLGLGPGRVLGILHELPSRRIEVAEFSPAILRAARDVFPHVAGDALRDVARVAVSLDDGRNRLQLGSAKLDLIVVAISGAAFAGSSNIYNQDFFEIVRSRLAPDGVLALWLQLHHLDLAAFRSVLATLRTVFPHVHVYGWPAGGQYYLVASPSPLYVDLTAVARLDPGPRVRSAMTAAGIRGLPEMAAWSVFTTEAELDRVANPRLFRRLCRDLDPVLEYWAAIGLANAQPPVDLRRYSDHALPEFRPPLSPGWEAGLRGLQRSYAGDKAEAVRQLRRSETLLGQPLWQPQLRALLAEDASAGR